MKKKKKKKNISISKERKKICYGIITFECSVLDKYANKTL